MTCLLPLSKGRKRGEEGKKRENLQEVRDFGFRERESVTSL